MANEEKVLEMLLKMDNRLATIDNRLATMDNRLTKIETDVSTLKTDVSTLKTDVSTLKTDVSNLTEDMSGVKIQLNENTQIIKAIRHEQEFAHAKLEALETTTAKSDALIKLDGKVMALNNRIFEQEATIQTLTLVK